VMNRIEHLLVIANEECTEVAQRVDKALRFGLGEVQPEQPHTNAQRILHEYCDLMAAIEMLADAGALDFTEITRARIDAKKVKVEKFMQLSLEQGTLDVVAGQSAASRDQALDDAAEAVKVAYKDYCTLPEAESRAKYGTAVLQDMLVAAIKAGQSVPAAVSRDRIIDEKLSQGEVKAIILAAANAEAWFTHEECLGNDGLNFSAYQVADELRGALGVVEDKAPELLEK
jgi:hypothetical protein